VVKTEASQKIEKNPHGSTPKPIRSWKHLPAQNPTEFQRSLGISLIASKKGDELDGRI
jgi:hypothetical protein